MCSYTEVHHLYRYKVTSVLLIPVIVEFSRFHVKDKS